MPSGPFDAIQGPIRRLHEMRSWEGEVVNYAPASGSGGEWWEDTSGSGSGWSDDGGETVSIYVETTTAPKPIRGPGGREITGDASITVNPADHPGGKSGFTAGAGEENRATEIVDSGGDHQPRYKVVRVADERNGVLILDCELLT